MTAFNEKAFTLIHGLSGIAFFDGLAIFFAQYLPYLLVLGFLTLAYYEKGVRRKIYVFCEGAIAIMLSRGIVTEVIRFFYHHERPFSFYHFTPLISGAGWSFPSGHAAWFFALSTVVWYANRKWGAWYFVLSAIMGFARIYVGVHWPLDIIGGAIVGILCGMAVHRLLGRHRLAIELRSAPLSTI